MSTRNALWLVCVGAIGTGAALADDSPGLGQELTARELAAVDFTIMPDGDGLPAGAGDAVTGRDIYNQNCLACHGENGTGGVNDVLSGGHGSLAGPKPLKTVGSYWPYATTIFDYLRRAMPFQMPGSLSNDDIYAVTAYLLFVNDIIAEDAEINAESLPLVKMPNRDNFVWGYTPE
ncbi:MAG: cytochrome c [Gammaproteobacteria bacterium]|nr:MAG: cytochrome c [Gammaproteobacteria bacterium]